MDKKIHPRLRGLAPVARGSQDAISHNLGSTFFTIPVHRFHLKLKPANKVTEKEDPREERGPGQGVAKLC